MSDTPPPVAIEPARKSFLGKASVVWIIPILALLIALGVAWQSYSDRGPLIEIEFSNGAGIAARETDLRYRDISVGVVEDVRFSDGLKSVIVSVRVDKDVAPYIDTGAGFWVVRPELTAQGVSGLDTVLTGVFIEGSWDSEIGPERSTFRGLEEAPLFRPGKEGLQIALRSPPGGVLSENSPILYRGIEVGRVGPARLSRNGNYAIAEAIIYEPHGKLITPSTRFWDTSGFSVSIGPGGAEVDFTSIASLLAGGITFDTFVSGGGRVSDGSVFEVFPEETAARNSVFNASEVETLELRVVFEDNISGLSLGAPVELSGLKIGTVENLTGIVDRDAFGDSRVRLNVILAIQPARLGLQEDVTPEGALRFLQARVREGLRARLASASLLTGGLKVELTMLDDVPPAEITVGEDSLPLLPSTESVVSDAAATVEGVFTRINSLPIEELLGSAIDFLDGAKAFIASDELRETPQEIKGLISDVRGLVTSQEVKDIPVSLNAALLRLETLLAEIETEQAVQKIGRVLDAAAVAAANVGTSVEGVSDLVAQLNAVAAKAEALPLEELTTQLTELLASADAVLGTPAAQELPASLGAALDELNTTLRDLREGGAVENVNATLLSARNAADAVALTSKDLPALVEQITRVFEQASATIAGYNKGEVISRDAQAALRDISQAAEAITSLVRLLERNPSALIRGR
jgi:paraquat-inducible protein B